MKRVRHEAMSSERRHRHVLDELLSRSAQVPRLPARRGTLPESLGGPVGDSTWESEKDEEVPTVWAPPAADMDAQDDGEREAALSGAGTMAAQASADTARSSPRGRMGRSRRPFWDSSGGPGAEMQVGRGPLASHLSRAAAEERLAETAERLDRAQRDLQHARVLLSERERKLDDAQARLAQSDGRLAQARAQERAAQERLVKSEEAERRAAEAQVRVEESSRGLAERLRTGAERETALAQAVAAERDARLKVELELARLRGSLSLLRPIVSGIDGATAERGDAAGARAPEDTTEPHERLRAPAEEDIPESESDWPQAGASLAALRATGEPPAPAPDGATAERSPLKPAPAVQEPASGALPGMVRSLQAAPDRWRDPGPRPAQPR
ncbi:MAG: hypothetical protein ACYDA6_10230 [Solirubrobacteraceae bacterium]